jgi:hypothetical protein
MPLGMRFKRYVVGLKWLVLKFTCTKLLQVDLRMSLDMRSKRYDTESG